MALTAQSIIQRAVQVLQDTTSVRWPVDELVRWLNDGQREIVLYRPDSNTKVATLTLATGSRQDLAQLVARTGTATFVSGATFISVASLDAGQAVAVGQQVSGVGIPAGTTISGFGTWNGSTGTVNISQATTATQSTAIPIMISSANTPAKLLDVIRNVSGTSSKNKAIRQVEREILDAQQAGWHGATGSDVVIHFTFDDRDPRAFYVYPPASGAAVEVIYSSYPTDVSAPSGADFTSVSGNISVADIYGNALLDYILYRAYMKDSEYAGNAQRAQAHYTALANSLGIELKGTLMATPVMRTTYNPNAAKRGNQAPQ